LQVPNPSHWYPVCVPALHVVAPQVVPDGYFLHAPEPSQLPV
jgi:hypothetical protein